jgi:hypothetical protein
VLSIGYAVTRGQFGAVFSNIYSGGRNLLDGRGFTSRAGDKPPRYGIEEHGPALQLHEIPYGAAILAGVTWAVLARYFPMLRIP